MLDLLYYGDEDDLDPENARHPHFTLLEEISAGVQPWADAAIDEIWRLAFEGDPDAQDVLIYFFPPSQDASDEIGFGPNFPTEGFWV